MLMRLPGLTTKVFQAQKELMAMLDELIAEHKMTWDPAQPPRDLTDAYLDEVEKVRGTFQGLGWGVCVEGPMR